MTDNSHTTAYVMTVDGPQSLDRIEAHALNTLSVMPASVDANDKLLLVREVKRLRQVIAVAFEDLECNNEASAFLVLKNSGVVNHG